MANEDKKIEIPDEVARAMSDEGATTTQKTVKTPDTSPKASWAQTDEVQKTEYPSEVVDLPSRGWFYDSNNPLSSGQIDIKYMTAREEDILTSQNLIKKELYLINY